MNCVMVDHYWPKGLNSLLQVHVIDLTRWLVPNASGMRVCVCVCVCVCACMHLVFMLCV